MNDPADAPTATGRRTWRLVRTLALPWVVCGGLLWALVGLTPEPFAQIDTFTTDDRGGAALSAGLIRPGPPHLYALYVCWNDEECLSDLDDVGPWWWEALCLGWIAGRSGGGPYWLALVGLWWLLPVPLLWSGFNLWWWVRQTK